MFVEHESDSFRVGIGRVVRGEYVDSAVELGV